MKAEEKLGEETNPMDEMFDEAWVVNESGAEYGTPGRPARLSVRTRDFALRIIRLSARLPESPEARVIGNQVLRCGTSVGAQYREAIRSRSDAEYISKLESAAQELEETRYWFELIIGADILPEGRLAALVDEANELMSILVACIKKAKDKRRKNNHSFSISLFRLQAHLNFVPRVKDRCPIFSPDGLY